MFNILQGFSERVALVSDKGEQISYRSLLERGETLAKHVGGRCLVFSICRNVPESVIGYVGFLRAGIVPLLLSDRVSGEALARLIAKYGPKYIYLPADFNVEGLAGKTCAALGDYRLISLDESAPCALNEQLALLLSTSGSTGSPKLVRISHENLESNTAAIIGYLKMGGDDRAITTMPMNYTYGLSIINSHLTCGASIVVTDAPVVSRQFWSLVQDSAATTFGGVPYTYEMLLKLKFGKMSLPSLRYLTQAGGRLKPALAAEIGAVCREKNIRFCIMYGQTEATARMSYVFLTEHPDKHHSIGRPIPGGEFWLMDPNGDRIEQSDVPGELVYQGPNVSMGYAESRADLSLGDVNGGVLRTGDIAAMDPDGFFYIRGRMRQFLKVFGLRINLEDVEELLHARGIAGACCGSDDQLLIFVTKLDDRNALESLISDKIGVHKSGFRLIEVAEIPRNSSGKVHYVELEKMAAHPNA